MPTYEYECDDCHHSFEKKQSFHAEPLTECPQCGGKVRRVFHPAPVIFKGSGFYVTDSRKNPASSMSQEDSKPADAESKGTESKGKDKK
ncbi:MAG: zinc ribbon domain-containing protein [Dehalococcoidia bacterium]|jgi:putative FmdB family regulatory protein